MALLSRRCYSSIGSLTVTASSASQFSVAFITSTGSSELRREGDSMVRHGLLRSTMEYVILDQNPLYAAARDLLRDSGVKPLRLPPRSPNLNAFAERFVGSVKSECLDRIVTLGEHHLRANIRAFVDHY